MQNVLLIFAKNLVLGKVKTRLAATIGEEKAFSIYKELLQHTKEITKNISADKIVFYSDNIDENDTWTNNKYKKQIQSGKDLGERMKNAFAYVFEEEYKEAIIIGTDCFELTPLIIKEAFFFLKKYDVVIGPAKDGGYYLLAMKKFYPFLFDNILWSTQTVFEKTIDACKYPGLSYYILPVLNDIDEEKDLQYVKPLHL